MPETQLWPYLEAERDADDLFLAYLAYFGVEQIDGIAVPIDERACATWAAKAGLVTFAGESLAVIPHDTLRALLWNFAQALYFAPTHSRDGASVLERVVDQIKRREADDDAALRWLTEPSDG